MIKNPAKYLDKILKILSEDFNRKFTIQEIQNIISPFEIFGESAEVNFSPDLLIDLRNALTFLNSKNLIVYNEFEATFKITFEGYLKLKTNSFSKEVSDKALNQNLQRISWVIPIVISILALIFSIKNSYHDNHENTNSKIIFSKEQKSNSKN